MHWPAPIRKRMRRFEIPGGIRFITFSCERRLPLLRNPSIAALVQAALGAARARFRVELFAWVVMPEHVHLLLRPADGVALDRALLFVKLSVAERVIARWRELRAPVLDRITRGDGRPRFWQKGGGFDRNVRNLDEFQRHVRYIHLNPVERGLVQNPDGWLFSSVRWWMGAREHELPCDPPPGDPRAWESWRGYV